MNLVTGATGLVGAHICAALLARGEKVTALVRDSARLGAIPQVLKIHDQHPEALEIVEGDILDPVSLDKAMRGKSNVFHCAAMVSFNAADRWKMMEVNAQGTAHVVNQCLQHDVQHMVHISSTSALGDDWESGMIAEQNKWTTDRGKSGYALSKRYAELEVQRGRSEGLSALIVNPAVVIGPGKWGESSTSMLVAAQGGMRFYPAGANAFVDARDVAAFCLLGLEKQLFEGRYILAAGNHSFKELFDWACQAYGSPRPRWAMPRTLALGAASLLKAAESVGLNPLKISAQSIQAAYRKMAFDASRARAAGFEFKSVKSSVDYAVRSRMEFIDASS